MPPSPPPRAPVRSAAALNAAIRAFWSHRDKRLDDREREEYHQLVAEWALATAVERGEIVEAA